jgi:hypothetical protein
MAQGDSKSWVLMCVRWGCLWLILPNIVHVLIKVESIHVLACCCPFGEAGAPKFS